MVEVRLRLPVADQADRDEIVELREADAIDAEDGWLFVWRGDEMIAAFERTYVVSATVRGDRMGS